MDKEEIKKLESYLKKGKYMECIEYMEKQTHIKLVTYGESSYEYLKSSEKLSELLNTYAILFLQKEQFEIAIQFLKKAEKLSNTSLRYKATTYNNLACYYRKTGKIRTSLKYLLNSLDIEKQKLDNQSSLADTHLNLCAVLSSLERHEEALEHSLLSIVMIQDEILKVALKQCQKQENNENKISQDRLEVLSIAYHNLGVEFEHLKRFDESKKIFSNVCNFTKENLGENHYLTQTLKKQLQDIQHDSKISKNNQRLCYIPNRANVSKESFTLGNQKNLHLHLYQMYAKNVIPPANQSKNILYQIQNTCNINTRQRAISSADKNAQTITQIQKRQLVNAKQYSVPLRTQNNYTRQQQNDAKIINSSCIDLNIMNDEEDIIQSKLILQDKNNNTEPKIDIKATDVQIQIEFKNKIALQLDNSNYE